MRKRAPWLSYGIAAVCIGAMLGLRRVLQPWLGDHHPFLTLMPAVMVSAWFGGLGPGLFVTVVGTVSAWTLFGDVPRGFVLDSPDDYIGFCFSIVGGVTISLLNHVRIRAEYHALDRLAQVKEARECLQIEIIQRAKQHEELLLSQQKLLEARKMEAVGRLAGAVAHDFNNLMMIVMGNVELAETSLPQNAEEQAYLHCIGQAAQRAADVTARLLAYGGKHYTRSETVNLSQLINEVGSGIREWAGARIDLAVIASHEIWPIRADTGQLKTILLSLAANACDAMPQGGTLTIEASNSTIGQPTGTYTAEIVPGEYAPLTVRDTGRGIPECLMERIFEPFLTTKEFGSGAGLGLATSFSLIKQFHGYVRVESEQDRGTTFFVYFPRSQTPSDKSEAPPNDTDIPKD